MSAVRHCYSPDAPQTERLAAYLEEKEARVERRKAFARRHAGETVVQLVLNIPGRIKDSALLRRLLASGMSEFALRFPQLTECALTNASAGPSALFAAAEAPQSVKEKTAELEALHPWSRLFDFDVYDAGGKTVSLASRHGMGRTCFVCSRPAALCMREKSHSAEDVAQSVTDRLARFAAYETAFTVSAAARRAGALALRAALYEVGLQPKPGLVDPAHSGSHEDMDFFTLKGAVEAILKQLRVKDVRFEGPTGAPSDASWHPGRCATVWSGSDCLGILGQVHPLAAQNFGVDGELYCAELSLDELMLAKGADPEYVPLPKFPAVTRDIAVVCDEAVTVGQLERAIREGARGLLKEAALFDIYRGTNIPAGKKSVAFNLVLRADDRSLTAEEADNDVKAILATLEAKCGAVLR